MKNRNVVEGRRKCIDYENDYYIISNFIFGSDIMVHIIANTLASGSFRGFSEKKRLNARGFAREFLWSGMLYRPSKNLKRCDKSSSLHSKKNFLLGGCGFFVSDFISRGLLGHLGPLCLALGANR